MSNLHWHNKIIHHVRKKQRGIIVLLWIKKSQKLFIIKQTQFQNIYLKLRTAESKIAYTKQRKCCISLTRKGKRGYYDNQDEKDVTDNEKSFSDKKSYF